MNQTKKICTKCKTEKPTSEFYKRSDCKNSYTSQCKNCQNQRYVNYRASHKKEIADYHRKRRLQNPDLMRIAWVKYYKKNKKQVAISKAKYRIDNAEKISEKAANNYKNNKEHYRKMHKEYLKTPKGKAKVARDNHRRRTQKRETDNTLTSVQWMKILMIQNNRCANCNNEFDAKLKPERDHIIPISMGGGLTFGNIQALCKSCNCHKSASVNFSKAINNLLI